MLWIIPDILELVADLVTLSYSDLFVIFPLDIPYFLYTILCLAFITYFFSFSWKLSAIVTAYCYFFIIINIFYFVAALFRLLHLFLLLFPFTLEGFFLVSNLGLVNLGCQDNFQIHPHRWNKSKTMASVSASC